MFVSARQERRTIANSAGQWNINAISQRSLLRQRCQRREKKPLRYQDYLRYFRFFSSSTMYGITMAVQVHILFHEVHLFASKKGQTGLFILFSSFLSSLSCPPIHGKPYGKWRPSPSLPPRSAAEHTPAIIELTPPQWSPSAHQSHARNCSIMLIY